MCGTKYLGTDSGARSKQDTAAPKNDSLEQCNDRHSLVKGVLGSATLCVGGSNADLRAASTESDSLHSFAISDQVAKCHLRSFTAEVAYEDLAPPVEIRLHVEGARDVAKSTTNDGAIQLLGKQGHALMKPAPFRDHQERVPSRSGPDSGPSTGQLRDIVVPPNFIIPGTAHITSDMLPLIDLNQADIDRIVERVPGGIANIQDIYALSPLQDGILFHHLMSKNGDPYVQVVSMSFERRESLDQYVTTFRQVVDRHDILRTAFLWQDLSTPAQVVLRDAPLSITELQLDPNAGPVAEQIEQLLNTRSYRMDLRQAPLWRFITAQEHDGRWILFEVKHHLIGDHSTSAIIQLEMQAFFKGQGAVLPPAHPYRNLVAQTRLGVSQEENEKFFKEMLGDIDTPSIPFGITDVHGDRTQVTESRRKLPQDLHRRLRSQARRMGVSVARLCHVAWAQVIARTSGQQRVVFGTVLHGRKWAATSSDRAMGLFVNTLPIRIDLDMDTIEECVRATDASIAALLEHEHASLALAQRCSSVGVGVPLFSALLNYRRSSTSLGKTESWNGMKFLGSKESTNYPFCLSVEDYETSLGLTALVVQPLDPARVCGYMQEALDSLADALEYTPNTSASKLEVLPTGERQMLLREWNATQENYPKDLCLHHLFEHQVERTPGATAVMHEDQSLTYAELNNRANWLAHRLISLGVEPDSLVVICVERSLSMIVGILAILKAGGAYVPLDPSHASDRLRNILRDTAPVCVVADRVGRMALGEALSSLSVLDPNNISTFSILNPTVPALTPRHLAYVIFTSGTTGTPKGVMVEHQGAVSLVTCRQEYLCVQSSSQMTQFFSIGFDPSVLEIFGSLGFGGSLHVLKDDIRLDRNQLWRYMDRHSITHAIITPVVLQDCVDVPPVDSMSTLIIGGESLSTVNVRRACKLVPNGTVINTYGPTETSVAATSWICTDVGPLDTAPIGRPLPNRTIYLRDTYGNPVPLGAIGEIFIGGIGVARGYLNRPDLTREKFLADPFSGEAGARMYRTGDLAKYLPDGNLVYMGRSDDQVKIRGFRIELGEIETRLIEHPLVSDAVVIAQGEETNRRLIAYVVAHDDAHLGQGVNEAESSFTVPLASTLRSHLTKRLPEYMIPAAFVHLDAFPVTSNSKLDRRALPAPSDGDFARQLYEAPQGGIECAIASIWMELLHVEKVGRHDGFFGLGGHSLHAVRLMNGMANLGADLSLSVLFRSPTLAAFASAVSYSIAHGTEAYEAITPVSRDTMLPISFAQQRLWFLAQLEGVGSTYHIPIALKIRGVFNKTAWQQAMDDLYARHEALRSAFVYVDGEPQVHILQAKELPLRYYDLRSSADRDTRMQYLAGEETRRPFNLAQGPLIRGAIVQLRDDQHVVFVIVHHIISDGWSSGVMVSEISQLYTAYCKGESNPLIPLTIQYPDYAAWQRQRLSGDHLQTQSEYWYQALSGAPPLLDLPTDRPRPPQQSFQGDHAPITLNAQLVIALKQFSQKLGVTLFMTLLSAWSVVLSRLSGQDDIVIGTPTANRSRQEIEPLIGFFVNTLALRIDLSAKPSVRELLERVRRCTIGAYAHQDLPFEQIVEIVQPPRRVDATPLFQVMFVLQNNDEGNWNLSGLQVSPYELDHGTAKFDLTLALWESHDGITGSLEYSTSLFDRSSVERHTGYLHIMLQTMVSDVDQSIAAVDILSPSERTLLLDTWNNVTEEYPDDLCLHHLFEQQVRRTPDAIAVMHEDHFLTYAELNSRANSLAHHLISLGVVQPDSLVAICVERSLSMIVGILAILKAGGAYVPLDPSHASDRLRNILRDTAPVCVVADRIGRIALGEALSSLSVLDPNNISTFSILNPTVPTLTSHHLAYVIFTSGTTGIPKGVMIEHQGIVSYVQSEQQTLQVQPSSRMTQFFSVGFDASVLEIFGTLCFGGSLHLIADDSRMDYNQLWRYLEHHGITHAMFTPSMFQDCDKLSPLSAMAMLLVCGESLPATLVPKLQKLVPNGFIFNMYGPTETTVVAISWKCSGGDLLDTAPIGRPLPNRTSYLLDTYGNPVPLGAIGEIFIGGIGVARGYLNKPDLTAEKFLADPFSGETGARMYRTGDLAKYLPDGNLVYMSRNDHQVKIRGFRIELGEIEARLTELPMVSEAVVLAQGEESNKHLVAYIVALRDMRLEGEENAAEFPSAGQLASILRSNLSTRLPDYMIPAAYVHMDVLPLTPNGKLDRNALPVPGNDAFVLQAYEEPRGIIENVLSSVWGDLFDIERVGRNDGFFDLGGHSLLAVRMIDQVRTKLGFDVSLRTLFEAPTIAQLAPRLLATGTTNEDSYDVLLPIKPRGSRLPLFCIHPAGGLSWLFVGLSTRLHPDQPLYGLQARGFTSDSQMASTLDEMVRDYIDQIRRIQPQGPYRLLGYSFGGLVAHTMASYLEKQGEHVDLVALMDTRASYHHQDKKEQEMPDLVAMLFGNKAQFVSDLTNPFLERVNMVYQNNRRMYSLEIPRVISGDLIIFRATVLRNGAGKLLCPDEWKPYVLGEIEVYDIDCDHDSIDLPEPMAIIGQVLNRKLNELHNRTLRED